MQLGDMPVISDYSLCRDAVTVYHEEGGAVTRTVHPRAYLEHKKVENVDRTGSEESNGFLLVVPGESQACRVGDKVLLGEGPEVPADGQLAWWRSLVPARVDGLAVVRWVDRRRWGGRYVHTEAGG